jgi:RNA polymerase sigma factor (TIGR02999 family)
MPAKGLDLRIPDHPTKVTGLLLKWRQGDDDALGRLIPLVYRELHQIARRHMRHERPGHSLQTTALVNEAYLRLVDAKDVAWSDRTHFLAVAARVMRRILVDDARSRGSQKRGGRLVKIAFDEALVITNEPPQGFAALDDALQALAVMDERKSRVIELRYFGGLTIEETASILDVSPDTVMRDWRLARAWLQREMQQRDTA